MEVRGEGLQWPAESCQCSASEGLRVTAHHCLLAPWIHHQILIYGSRGVWCTIFGEVHHSTRPLLD